MDTSPDRLNELTCILLGLYLFVCININRLLLIIFN